MDFYPTFAAAAGARVPGDRLIDGVDLTPLLTPSADASSPPSPPPPPKPVRDTLYYYGDFGLAAVRKGDFKLIFPGRPPPDAQKTLLFNVRQDPGETKDLYSQHPQIVAELEKVAEEARKDLGDARTGAPGQNRRPPGRSGSGEARASAASR
jgi:arylsulfatase